MDNVSVQLEDSRSTLAGPGMGRALSEWLAGLTVGDGLYGLVVAAGVVIRLIDLGRLPLSPAEAGSAWQVWQQWQASKEAFAVASPAYFNFTAPMTQVLGFSDGVMRLLPALFGIGIIILPWFLRQRLGTIGAMLFALMLATSPLYVAVSRTATGDSIALFAALLAAVAWIRWRESGERAWLYTLGIGVGLGLASSPLFYGAVVGLTLAALAKAILGPTFEGEEEPLHLSSTAWRRAALYGGLAFAAAATMLLWYPAGIASAAALPGEWLAQFSLRGDWRSLVDPLLALARYEVLLVLIGLFAIARFLRRGNSLGTFGSYWLLATALLLFLQPGRMANAPLLALPGYLLVALLAKDTLGQKMDLATYGLAGAIVIGGGLILVNLGQYSRVFLYNPQQLSSLWTAFLVVAVLSFAIYFVASWKQAVAIRAMFLGVIALAVFYQWGTAWWLGHEASNDPRERWVRQATDDDVLVLGDLIQGISRQATGTDHGVDIFSTVDSSALRWYLRDFSELRFGATLPPTSRNSLVITPQEEELALTSEYAGAGFGLVHSDMQMFSSANPNPMLDTLRWWLFHDTTSKVSGERLTLWWRADLIQGLE